MGLMEKLGFKSPSSAADMNVLPLLFTLGMDERSFVAVDIETAFNMILTDTLERTEGIPDKYIHLLWDNCVMSESSDGLVTMLSKAMLNREELFLVFKKEIPLLRRATSDEAEKIKSEYMDKRKSSTGIYISFKNLTKADMLKIYSTLEYCTVGGLYKGMNLSKALQFKMKDMRASVGSIDSSDVVDQAIVMAKALAEGRDVLTDSEDKLELAKPDLEALDKSMSFIDRKRSFYLSLPPSYFGSDEKSSLGDSGEGDSKKVEKGLKKYYFSIIKPVVETIFEIKTTFKSDDFRMLDTALNALKTFELTSDEYIRKENKLLVINKLFGFPDNEKGGPEAKPETTTTVPPASQPVPKDPAK